MDSLNKKRVLILGGTGSWGQELTSQILDNYAPEEIVIFSRSEAKQVVMKRSFNEFDNKIKYIIGDIRDKEILNLAMKDIDYVFHLAALKHVPVCEENPEETTKTNVYGTMNVVDCAIQNDVVKVILVSTDKAVDPINTYGVSKSLAEKIIIGGNYKRTNTVFSCIRAGNVMGTNGSVIPLFREQILNTNSITLTEETMTRYIMSLSEAISLIFTAFENSLGGEIFVTKMPAIRIIDLVNVMKKRLGNKDTEVINIGIRPGEKMYEVLVSSYEVFRTYEFDKNLFVILPNLKIDKLDVWKTKNIPDEYNSLNTNILDEEKIEEILEKGGWFKEVFDSEEGLKIIKNKKNLLNISKLEKWKNE